jgi:ABC-2 type transport system permease protein
MVRLAMHNIKFIAKKEFKHILRDPRSLIIAILMPILMTFLYGYAINLDIKNIKIAILDFDQTADSRELTSRFYNSGYFMPPDKSPSITDPERLLKAGGASSVLIILPGFSKAIAGFTDYELGMFIDGSDANMAAAATSYSNIILNSFVGDRLPAEMELPGVKISARVLYNSDLKSSHFFVPGLIAVILMMISALLTSVTIAREKESGTMEQLLTTPVNSRQIIIGKVAPYIGLALLDAVMIIIFALIVFGVPFNGSALLLLLFCLIYVFAALSIGILISTLVSTQQLAMMLAQMITVLPSVMLSGYIFEIKNMPLLMQYVTYLIPARYFILIIRGIMLKGSDITVLWVEAAFLLVLTVGLLFAASRKFRLKIG